VVDSDPRQAGVTEIDHVPDYVRDEIAHFFEVYKALEPGKDTTLRGWEGRSAAESAVEDARQRYKSHQSIT